MNIIITPSEISGEIIAPSSKSQAHRLLIAAVLSDLPTDIVCSEVSLDIETTVNCLRGLGADITRKGSLYCVDPLIRPGKVVKIDCGESGTTLRLILSLMAALGINGEIYMSESLASRPTEALTNELNRHGAGITRTGKGTLVIEGYLSAGDYELPGNISSQYISSLLFALPLLTGDSILTLKDKVESSAYINMTVDTLKQFSILIEKNNSFYSIKGNQKYRSPVKVKVEGDWSNAAFWLCAGAISGRGVECTGLNPASLQGDREIAGILRRFGANVTENYDNISVFPSELNGTDIDAADIPDLVPVIALTASVAEGISHIYNAKRLRLKESDRLKSVTQMLLILGADITEEPEGLTIYGRKRLHGGTVASWNDHRIAMSAAIASSVCENNVTILDADAVKKSYPLFWKEFANHGGIIKCD